MNRIERKIGDVFNYNGSTFKVVEAEFADDICFPCYFDNKKNHHHCHLSEETRGFCGQIKRSDNTNVVFIEQPINTIKQ
jgi:hypothetical protein